MAFSAGVCSASFCQHPECWKASVQKVREAVRLRNGIKCERENGLNDVPVQKKWNMEPSDEPLPTLKVIDAFGDADLGSNYANGSSTLTKSPSFPTRSSCRRHQRSNSLMLRTPAPRPSPTSPTVTEYQKHMFWKQTMPTNKASAVGVFELFDEEEMQQDWQDVFITSAYLVWCPSSKEKNEKRKRVSSSKSDSVVGQMKKVLPKDLTETMMPSALESPRPIKPKSSKKPSGGQPYSPNRTPQKNYIHIEHLDLAKYGLTDLPLPQPVLAGILKQLQPSQPEENKEREEKVTNKENDDKIFEGKEHGKKKPTSDSVKLVPALVSEECVAEEDTHKLDVDIGSQFKTLDEGRVETEKNTEEQKSVVTKDNNLIKHEIVSVKEEICQVPVEKAPLKQVRQPLAVSSVGIPAEYLPKIKSHHCVRSIPNYQLKAAMEPVTVVPGTFSPSVTPPNEVISPHFQRSGNSFPSMYLDIHSGQGSEFDRNKGHLTSALGLSPVPLRVPAPTPNSPDKTSGYFQRQYLRSSRSSASARRYSHRKRNEDQTRQHGRLSFSFSDVERGWVSRSAGRRTELREPSLQIRTEQNAFNPRTQESGYRVFLTEEAVVRYEPAVTPVHSCSDFGDWPKSEEVINIIEPDHLATRHSLGFKGNTQIPSDLVAVESDSSWQKNYPVSQKVPKRFNALPESTRVEEHAKCMVITEGGMSAPSWRPPRSRTPLQFLSTPSRSAPKPLRQPPIESVPRSLSVQRLETPLIKRSKSTPFREKIPDVDPQVQPVLSDSSLNPELKQQCSVNASRMNSETEGLFPPPPSPEVQNDTTSGLLETLNEEEERSSVASSVIERVAAISDAVNPSPLGEEDGKDVIKSSIQKPLSSRVEVVYDTVESQTNDCSLSKITLEEELTKRIKSQALENEMTVGGQEQLRSLGGNLEKKVIAGTRKVENEVNTKTEKTKVVLNSKETNDASLHNDAQVIQKNSSSISSQPSCASEDEI